MELNFEDIHYKRFHNNPKEWLHDRSKTIGASEIASCERRIVFAKILHPETQASIETKHYGALVRGNIIESNHFLPAITEFCDDNGYNLLYAGDNQTTFTKGYASATPDGLIVGVDRDCLSHCGVRDVESDSVLVECKSVDPRLNLDKQKVEHEFQVQMQLGLVRDCTNHKPEYGLIVYYNASFLHEIKHFPIKFDPRIYEAGLKRAERIMKLERVEQTKPEGKIEGGRECKYCHYVEECGLLDFTHVPKYDQDIDEESRVELDGFAYNYKKFANEEWEAAQLKKEYHARIVNTLNKLNDYVTELICLSTISLIRIISHGCYFISHFITSCSELINNCSKNSVFYFLFWWQ